MRRRRGSHLSSDETADVGHIAQEQSTTLVSNGPEPRIVPVPGVGAASADDQLWAEVEGLLLEPVVIDVPSLGVHLVGQTLKVDGGGRDLLAAGCVVAVGQVATGREIQPHDTVVGVEEGGVGSEIRRATGVGLDVDSPGSGIQVERLEGAVAAEVLDLVDELVTTIVTIPRHALGVLVGEGAAEGLDDRERGEVLGGDELDPPALPPLLLLDQIEDLLVDGEQRLIAPRRDGIHRPPEMEIWSRAVRRPAAEDE